MCQLIGFAKGAAAYITTVVEVKSEVHKIVFTWDDLDVGETDPRLGLLTSLRMSINCCRESLF